MVFFLFIALIGCQSEEVVPELGLLEPPPEGEGFQLEMTAHAPAFTEVWQCEVYDVPADQISYVNWIEFTQNEGTHHMTLSVPNLGTTLDIENGTYDCQEIYDSTMGPGP